MTQTRLGKVKKCFLSTGYKVFEIILPDLAAFGTFGFVLSIVYYFILFRILPNMVELYCSFRDMYVSWAVKYSRVFLRSVYQSGVKGMSLYKALITEL